MDRQLVRNSVSFNLTRRFSILGFVVVVIVAGVLGLPLARRLVERMGGTLDLSSRSGAGTRVLIELPA